MRQGPELREAAQFLEGTAHHGLVGGHTRAGLVSSEPRGGDREGIPGPPPPLLLRLAQGAHWDLPAVVGRLLPFAPW